MNDSTLVWTPPAEAAKQLHIGESTLRVLKRTELKAGTHWCWLTGRPNGPIGYNVPAIREWQRQKTLKAAAALTGDHNDIETFDSEGA